MRVEVPEKVFAALQSYRQRLGSMALVDIEALTANLREQELKEEADWVEVNYNDVIKGSVVGFAVEGTQSTHLMPEPPRGSDPMED